MRKLLLFAALIATMFASCDMLEDRPSSDESNFLVLTKLVEIAAEGGEGVIEYTISQPTEGLEVSATTNNEWITNITVEKSVRFSVVENNDKEQRVGFITLAYGAEEHTVGVQQAGGSGNSVTIFLEQRKLEVTAKGGALISVVPMLLPKTPVVQATAINKEIINVNKIFFIGITPVSIIYRRCSLNM